MRKHLAVFIIILSLLGCNKSKAPSAPAVTPPTPTIELKTIFKSANSGTSTLLDIDNISRKIIKSSSGGFVIAGNLIISQKLFVIELDSNANCINAYYYSPFTSNSQIGTALCAPGGFYLNGYDNYAIKLDSFFAEIWRKSIPTWAVVSSGIEDSVVDEIVYCGATSSPTKGLLIKVDSSGDCVWAKAHFAGNLYDVVKDSNYIYSIGSYFLKADFAGNCISAKNIQGDFIELSNDGNLIIYKNSTADDKLIKIDSNGNILFEKTYHFSNDDYVNAIKQTSEGLICAVGIRCDAGPCTAFMNSFDVNGNFIKADNFNGYPYSNFSDIKILEDGNVLVLGNNYGGVAFAKYNAFLERIW